MLRPFYVGSFPTADASLSPALPEIALIGRSNVGKSSLLNALAGRRIAKVSGTPGKTRMLNVFEMPSAGPVGAQHAAPLHDAYYLLDLPGYGYSRASRADRAAFRGLITHTLERARLAGVLWLLDIRREPSDDDRATHELFAGRETRVLAVLTKSDTLPRAGRGRRERELREALALDADQVIRTSAREQEGVEELREAIGELVGTSGSPG
jgi:GTP-binding protein